MRPLLGRLSAAFVAGAVLGSAVTALMTAHRIDHLTLSLERTRVNLAERREEVARLRSDLDRSGPKELVIRSVEVAVSGVDGPDALAVHQSVTAVLSALPGLRASRVDPAVLEDLLDGRIVATRDEKLFRLHLVTAVIGEALRVAVTAKPIGGMPPAP